VDKSLSIGERNWFAEVYTFPLDNNDLSGGLPRLFEQPATSG